MIKKFAFVGHPSKDMQKAKQFYGELLGLKLDAEYTDKWIEYSAPDGKVVALDGYSPELSPEAGPFLALETDDIEKELGRLKAAGTTILKDLFDNGTCKMAIIQDPNGNNLMLHEIAPDRCEPQG